jgi:hypothetical protein
MLRALVNCAMVLKNASISSSFFHSPKAEQRPYGTCQLRKDRVFEALIGSFMIVNCGMKEKHLIQMRNEYSPQLSKLMEYSAIEK